MPYRKPVEPIVCEIEVPAEGYTWERATAVGSTKQGWFLVEKNATSLVRPYEPIKTATGLFRAFAALEPTRESFLAFANEYGRLGVSKETEPGERLELWNEEAARMREAVGLLDAIQAGDGKALAQRGRYRAGSAAEVALLEFQDTVNRKLRRYVSTAQLLSQRGKPGLDLYFVPSSLLACMWLQLARAAAGDKKHKQCDQCRRWFEVSATAGERRTRSDRSYCSDACRAKAYRERKGEAAKAKAKGRKRSGRAKRR